MLYLKDGFVTVYKICTHKLSLADWNPVEKQSNFIVFPKYYFHTFLPFMQSTQQIIDYEM